MAGPWAVLYSILEDWRSLRECPWLGMFYGATASMFARVILTQEHPSLSYDRRLTLYYRAAIDACLQAQGPALPLPVFPQPGIFLSAFHPALEISRC